MSVLFFILSRHPDYIIWSWFSRYIFNFTFLHFLFPFVSSNNSYSAGKLINITFSVIADQLHYELYIHTSFPVLTLAMLFLLISTTKCFGAPISKPQLFQQLNKFLYWKKKNKLCTTQLITKLFYNNILIWRIACFFAIMSVKKNV